ncbi:MAG: hypothetical protein GY807_10545 [Gammaproteobacteria bacterium]|nr:hypothetical protein [Gammaproteobacteria bacterium]
MQYLTKKNADTQSSYSGHGPAQKMHRNLMWVLGSATGALIINAMVVIALVDGG